MAKYRITSIPQYKNGGGHGCDEGYEWDEELQTCIKAFKEVIVNPEDESWWDRMTRKAGKAILNNKVNKNNKNKKQTFDEFRRDTEFSSMYDLVDWATKPKESTPKKLKKPTKEDVKAQQLFNELFHVLTAEDIAQKKLADLASYNAQVDAETARQAANVQPVVPAGSTYPNIFNVNGFANLDPISEVDSRIEAAKKKGMVYRSTADELNNLYTEKDQLIAKEEIIKKRAEGLAEQQRKEQEFYDQRNPRGVYSETIQNVAGNSGVPQTLRALDAQIGAKQEYHQKRKFVTDTYLYANRDALVNEAARSIQNSSNLTYEQALEQAKQDENLLYRLAEKHTPTEASHLDNLAQKLDFYDYKNSRNDQIKSFDPTDPNHISFENPGTVGGYLEQVKNTMLNPLDAAHYAMSSETMPFNYGAYEKMKEQTGYRDDADNNAIMQGIDFASWFHPIGLYGQGIKMIRPTAESVENVYNNPTWENLGTAGFDVGMNALILAGAKSPLKFLAEENSAIKAAQEAEVYEFGSKLNKFNRETYTGPQYYSEQPIQKSLLLESGSVAPGPGPGPALLPIGVATEVGAKAGVTTGTTPLLNITPIGFNPKMEIEGATVYNKLLEQKRLQDIAALNTTSSVLPIPEGFVERKAQVELPPLVQEEKVFGMTPTETIPSSTDAKNQFLKDLQNDPEYIGFKENATIRDQEGKAQSSFGVPNSITKDQFKNAGNTDETIFSMTEESTNSVPRKNLNDPEYVDDEVVADIIDDMRVNKMELWETPEGKRRLHTMIANTESLRSNNVTPESIVERMRSLNVTNRIRLNSENKLKALDEEEDLIDFLYDDGHMDKTDWMDRSIDIEEARQAQNLIIDGVNERMAKSSAFYSNRNIVGIRPKDYNINELDIVTAHEFGHFLAEGKTTYLDDMLNDLTLIDNTSAQLTIPGIGGGTESKAAARFGHDRPNYLEESLDYFKNGSEGTEKVPFLSEVRKAMLKDGTIKHEFDKITPEMLKKHYDKYKKNNDEKYPIRLYDIIKDNKKNFTVMSNVLDHLPIVLQALGMADALFGHEDVDTKEAGFSILLGAMTRGKGKALKFGKNLKKYTGLMHEAYAPRIFQTEMRNFDKLSEIRFAKNKEVYGIISSPEVEALEKQIKTLSDKIAASPIIGSKFNPSSSSVVDLYIKNKELDKLKIQLTTLKKTEEGIQVKNSAGLDYVTDTGQKPVTSFRTKQPVIAKVKLPTKTYIYTLEGKDVVFKHHEVLNPEISQNYVDVLSDNISIVEETGAKVIGSAVGVVEGGLTHLTGDIDAIILDTDYAKNVLNKLDFVGPNGPAKVHDIGINNGKEGHIDFNVIKTNPDGTVGVTWQKSYGGYSDNYRSLEMELFRQFFPDEYYKLQKELIQKSPKLFKGHGDPINVTKMNIKIPIQADVFIKKIDPAVKTIVDAYESSKLKHINRIDTYINYGNVDVVNRAQETYVKSLVGSKGTVGPQLSTEALSDIPSNIEALNQMRFIGDVDFVAKDPKRMQLALNDYYINHTVHNRNISIGGLNRNIDVSFKKWQGAESSNSGGSAMGWGLNTTKLGDPRHPGNIAGQMQYGIKTDTGNVIDYVNSIDWATTSVAFNESERSQVQDIIASHSTPEFAEEQMVNIQESGNLLAMHNQRFTDKKSLSGLSITEKVDIQKIFNDITKRMGIRSTSDYKDTTYGKSYYSSILGDFDEAIDLLEYSILSSALKPKSLFERRDNYNIYKTTSGAAHDPYLIDSLKDYKRIEGYLSEGLAKAQKRAKEQTAYIVKLQEEQALLAEKLMYKRNPAYKKIVDDIAKGKAEIKKIDDEIEETSKRLDAISDFKRKTKPLLVIAGLAALGTGVLTYYANHNEEIDKFRDDMLEIDKTKVKNIKFKNNNPRDIDIQIEKWQKKGVEGDTNKTIKKQKTGGQIDNYFEIDIPKEDLQRYLEQGYIVEEVEDTLPKKANGGLPYQVWKQYTGTPWSEAKKQGLTDGTAKANLALRDRLLAGEFGEAKMSDEEVSDRHESYKNMVSNMISNGATLEELVARRIGTKEGLTNMFSELSTPVDEDLSKYAAQIKPKEIPLPKVFPQQIENVNSKVKTEDQWGRTKTNDWYGFNPDTKKWTVEDQWGRSPDDEWYNFNEVTKKFKHKESTTSQKKVDITKNFEKDLLNRLTTIAKQKALLKPESINKVEPIPNSMASQFSKQDFNKKSYDANGKEIKPIMPKMSDFKTDNPVMETLEGVNQYIKKIVEKPFRFVNDYKNEVAQINPKVKKYQNTVNTIGTDIQKIYYDLTNPNLKSSEKTVARQKYNELISKRTKYINAINDIKRDDAGWFDAAINDVPTIGKPFQKLGLSDQPSYMDYDLPKFETYSEKKEKEDETFRQKSRFEELNPDKSEYTRWKFRAAASNDDPIKVSVYGTRGERANQNININSKGTIMHFLDQSPETGYIHKNTKNYYNKLKDDDYVGYLKSNGDNTYGVQYKPKKEFNKDNLYKNTFIIRQVNFDDIDFNKKVKDDNFSGHTYPTLKGTTQAALPISSDPDENVYNYSSGQSVVFIFKYKGKIRYEHFAGSSNEIKKEGQDIKKLYNLDDKTLKIGLADAGSYSSAISGKITNDKLNSKDYGYYNPNTGTGAGMAILP